MADSLGNLIRRRFYQEVRYAVYQFVKQLHDYEPHPILSENANEAICFIEAKHLELEQVNEPEKTVQKHRRPLDHRRPMIMEKKRSTDPSSPCLLSKGPDPKWSVEVGS